MLKIAIIAGIVVLVLIIAAAVVIGGFALWIEYQSEQGNNPFQ